MEYWELWTADSPDHTYQDHIGPAVQEECFPDGAQTWHFQPPLGGHMPKLLTGGLVAEMTNHFRMSKEIMIKSVFQ